MKNDHIITFVTVAVHYCTGWTEIEKNKFMRKFLYEIHEDVDFGALDEDNNTVASLLLDLSQEVFRVTRKDYTQVAVMLKNMAGAGSKEMWGVVGHQHLYTPQDIFQHCISIMEI